MSVSVSMPQLGESVTEGTVTRWLKREGEHVQADEPLLEVSTEKVDTEIPSPVSGTLRGITVAEDETVEVGAELAVIDEDGAAPAAGQPAAQGGTDAAGPGSAGDAAPAEPVQPAAAQPEPARPDPAQPEPARPDPAQPEPAQPATAQPEPAQPAAGYQQQPPAAYQQPPSYEPAQSPGYQQPAYQQPYEQQPYEQQPYEQQAAVAGDQPGNAPQQAQAEESGETGDTRDGGTGVPAGSDAAGSSTEGPYVTPLVRKLAAEHGVDLATVTGTGVGGRIRKQDILDTAQPAGNGAPAEPGPAPQAPPVPSGGPAQAGLPQPAAAAQSAPQDTAAGDSQPASGSAPPPAPLPPAPPLPSGPAADTLPPQASRPPVVPSQLRGTTERMSRARQVIAQRMIESLQTSAQLTTVVEVDVTAIARLRDRAKAAFFAREGVKLSFLPFFALAAVDALKVHPRLNAVINTASGQVTYHDAEHLGIAVDTDRGLMVPVIRNAGDLNIGGLARKIADLAERTRTGRVSPDDLSGGTFTLTNTGSRGALFDTPIINQPQVAILGTGTVVKRAVVVEDPALGEVITVRSMVYLALTYDHRLVDGADAARFLITMKSRLEDGTYEAELGY